MKNNWKETTLGEIAYFVNEKIGMKDVPLDRYISTENLLPDKLGIQIASSLPNISKVSYFSKEDVLFSNIRTYFKKVWFSKFDGGASNDVLIFRPIDDSVLNKKYLYYFISSERFINFTVLSAKGTKMPRGDKEAMRRFKINLPLPPEQKAIAGVLSSLDEKIELLRAQNETLEKTAQTIFKEWFVNFNFPDENGKPYKDAGGKMIDSELGKIPPRWRVGKIGNETNIKQGKYLKADEISDVFTKDKSFPIYGGNGVRGYIKDFVYEKPQVVLTCRGNGCGLIQLTRENSTITNSCMAFENEKSVLSYEYLYFWAKRMDFESVTSGSAQPQITVTNLYSLEIVIPDEDILKNFVEMANSIFQKIQNNNSQIQTLSKTRDTLLPKLMSGEIMVK